MAYDFFGQGPSNNQNIIQIEGKTVELPDASYIRDAAMIRDGGDLTLDGPQGTVTIEGYFSAAETPDLTAPGGLVLTPELVESFARSPARFAQNASMNDESPVGAVDEVSGEATITHLDGSVESVTKGTLVYQGDVIETSADGAVNISFIDDTSFAVSEEARLAIDEYVFDPATEAGSQNFSVLKGVFVFTSGLIGRDDPDDVNIDTPSGSIGIRGTIIAGDVDTGEITVVEGAIVLRDHSGNEMTLASRFETAKMDANLGGIKNMGKMGAQDMADRFVNVSDVSPTLFSSINDAMAEQAPDAVEAVSESQESFDADGSVDENNDGEVDGTLNETGGESTGEQNGGGEEPAPTGEETLLKEGELLDKPLLSPESEPLPPPPSDTMGTGDTLGTTDEFTADDPLMQTSTSQDTNTITTSSGDNTTTAGGDTALPPPPPPQDPDTILPPPLSSGDGNIAPINFNHLPSTQKLQHSGAPASFFHISDGQTWNYHFDLDFFDKNAGDTLTYSMTPGALPPNVTLGAINPTTGLLSITAGTLTGSNVFSFTITATDNSGASDSYTYNFVTDQKTATLGSSINFVSSGVYTDSGGTGLLTTIGNTNTVSNTLIFAGAGNDTIVLSNGDNNYINLGNDLNAVTINSAGGNFDNTVVGGFHKDTIQLDNVYNRVYAMDGDDVIKINMDAGSAAADLTTNAPAHDIFIDGGHDNFVNAAAPDGKGDTLVLEGTGVNLNFQNINDGYIKGIERLDLTQTAGANITLGIADVIQMTNHNNTLIIRADDDTLNFVAGDFSGFTKQENQSIDDDAGGAAATNFDVYTNGNVTLLVEDTGASISGLPA